MVRIKNIKHFAFLILGILMLTGCVHSHSNIVQVAAQEPQATRFNVALEGAYSTIFDKGVVDFRKVSHDYQLIERKRKLVRRNVITLPEQVEDYELPYSDIAELIRGHMRLIKVLDMSARHTYPVDAAVAQALYDCWMVQSSGKTRAPYRPALYYFGDCRVKFYKSLKFLERNMLPPRTVNNVDKIVYPNRRLQVASANVNSYYQLPRKVREYIIFFDFNSITLDQDAQSIIREIVADAGQIQHPFFVRLVGHTDTVDDHETNMRLSQRRAESVKSALVQEGLDGRRLETLGRGESDLMVPTKDGIREAKNRRVEATIVVR